jgi:hypothetical protein
MANQSLWEEFSRGFGDAIADIREKVVEEPWYGRVVTDRDTAPQWPEARSAEPALGSVTHEREHAQEQEIDR